jgi:hypothetical protein
LIPTGTCFKKEQAILASIDHLKYRSVDIDFSKVKGRHIKFGLAAN